MSPKINPNVVRQPKPRFQLEIFILAGGLSLRMGRDKAKLRLGKKTLLGHIRGLARKLGWPVRVIRRDSVPRCGPVGGIYTALKKTSADAVLFLACDMPNVSEPLLGKLVEQSCSGKKAIFAWNGTSMGFPCLLNRDVLPIVENLLEEKIYSVQRLAEKAGGKKLRVHRATLINLNTPEDWETFQFLQKKT